MVAAEHTSPWQHKIASMIPYVAPAPSTIAPSDPTAMADVIICALFGDNVHTVPSVLPPRNEMDGTTHHVKSIEHTRVT